MPSEPETAAPMDVEPSPSTDVADDAKLHDSAVVEDEEEDVEDLLDIMDNVKVDGKATDPATAAAAKAPTI